MARFGEAHCEQVRSLQAANAAAEARLRAEVVLRDAAAQRTAGARGKLLDAREDIREARAEAAQARDAAGRAEAETARLAAQLHGARAHAERAEAGMAALAADRDAIRHVHERLVSSTIWRVTWPLRSALDRTPPRLRGALRGAAKLAWWSATLRLPSKLAQRRERIAWFRAQTRAALRTSAASHSVATTKFTQERLP